MARDKDKDFADDLFEPFELEEFPGEPSRDVPVDDDEATEQVGPPPMPRPVTTVPTAQVEGAYDTVRCPSCGADNPAHNRHCEECGARISQGPLPVAPAPLARSTPGGKALGVLFGVIGIVALIALFLNIFRGGNGPEVTDPTGEDVTTTSVPATIVATALTPVSVTASSELPNYGAENLIDGDISTYWNDASSRGLDATLEFTFAQPVAIAEIELQNIVDDVSFKRNYRIKDFQIQVDDLQLELSYEMPDNNEPYRESLNTLETRRLTITVLSTVPGEPVGDQPSYTELGLAEVRFYGTTGP